MADGCDEACGDNNSEAGVVADAAPELTVGWRSCAGTVAAAGDVVVVVDVGWGGGAFRRRSSRYDFIFSWALTCSSMLANECSRSLFRCFSACTESSRDGCGPLVENERVVWTAEDPPARIFSFFL